MHATKFACHRRVAIQSIKDEIGTRFADLPYGVDEYAEARLDDADPHSIVSTTGVIPQTSYIDGLGGLELLMDNRDFMGLN